jgi:hypothetical protein
MLTSAVNYLTGKLIKWNRISKKEIIDCSSPVTLNSNPRSPLLTHGASGYNYFTNALR